MRLRVPYENKTCFDCEQATDKGKMSVFCKLKGISVYASEQTYNNYKRERFRKGIEKRMQEKEEILFQGKWIEVE